MQMAAGGTAKWHPAGTCKWQSPAPPIGRFDRQRPDNWHSPRLINGSEDAPPAHVGTAAGLGACELGKQCSVAPNRSPARPVAEAQPQLGPAARPRPTGTAHSWAAAYRPSTSDPS